MKIMGQCSSNEAISSDGGEVQQEVNRNAAIFLPRGRAAEAKPIVVTTNISNNNGASTEVVFEYTGKGCSVPNDVTIVRFHPSVVEVEDYAFHDCEQLREVVFNDGLKKIGKLAFYSCTSLESITLPSTVIAIGGNTFNSCRQLREVILNEGLEKLGHAAFYCCASLLHCPLLLLK